MIKWDNPAYGKEEIQAATESLVAHLGANGPNNAKLEEELCDKLGVKHVITVNNCTSALFASCLVVRHIHGDITVGVPNFTFIASANTAKNVFSKVKLLDVSPKTWNIEKDNIDSSVQALISVDVGGLSCDYKSLKEIGIPIIADSAESIGAKCNGEFVGSQADMHCFSLHRAKIITCGEGGFISTNDSEIYKLLKSYINHGYDEKRKSYEYIHKTLGLNFRMSDVQAAIARVQLRKLDEFVSLRREIASIYETKLGNHLQLQIEPNGMLHPYFFYGVLVNKESRTDIVESLISEGVDVKTWSTVNDQEPYREDLNLPISQDIADRIILLPMNNSMSLKDAEFVSEKLLATI